MRPEPADSVTLAGMAFAPLTRGETVARIFSDLARGRGGWLLTANVDYVHQYATDPALRRLYARTDLTVADGVPLLWAARLAGHPLPDRVAGSDLIWLLAERAAQEGRSLYLLGGAPGAAEGAAERLRERFPALVIAGLSSPRVSREPQPAEIAEIRKTLERAAPDLVLVGLGAPKEGRVIDALRPAFPATWFAGVGISLSFAAGQVQRAPAWMHGLGVEWLHRLAQEPRRLLGRYLLRDLPFALQLLYRSWRQRRRLDREGRDT